MSHNIVIKYFTLVKFSHTLFALPFAIIGYFTALKVSESQFDSWLLLKVFLCMVLARTAAMAFNRYTDRNIDKMNPRTQSREIPAGEIGASSVLIFVLLNSAGFIITTWFINNLCFYLSPVALIVILGYSYTKRFTALCHLILGLGLSLAPIGAYIAVTGEFSLIPILFSASVLLWVGAFDIIYALQDDGFDRSQKLYSIPVLLGRKRAIYLSRFLHFISALILFIPGILLHCSIIYFVGWGVFSALLVYQHVIISEHNLLRVNVAFFTTNGIASVAFLCFFLFDYFY